MSVESILAHILSKADAQAKEIIAQAQHEAKDLIAQAKNCLLYTSPSPRD